MSHAALCSSQSNTIRILVTLASQLDTWFGLDTQEMQILAGKPLTKWPCGGLGKICEYNIKMSLGKVNRNGFVAYG